MFKKRKKKYYNNLRFFKRFVSIKKDQSNIEGLIQICKRPCLNIYLLIKHENPFFYPNFLVVHLAEGLIITYLAAGAKFFYNKFTCFSILFKNLFKISKHKLLRETDDQALLMIMAVH